MVNKVTLIGNSGTNAQLRFTKEGQPVVNIRLATQEPVDTEPEWHNITFFGNKAELAAQYIVKGKQIYIEGKLHTTKFLNKENRECTSTEIIVKDFRFLG